MYAAQQLVMSPPSLLPFGKLLSRLLVCKSLVPLIAVENTGSSFQYFPARVIHSSENKNQSFRLVAKSLFRISYFKDVNIIGRINKLCFLGVERNPVTKIITPVFSFINSIFKGFGI